jgi:hypothetical protein
MKYETFKQLIKLISKAFSEGDSKNKLNELVRVVKLLDGNYTYDYNYRRLRCQACGEPIFYESNISLGICDCLISKED